MLFQRSLAAAILTAVCSFWPAAAHAQAAAAQDYLSSLDNTRPDELADGKVVISMDAYAGDLRGVLTLTLSQEGESYKGAWAFSATFLEDVRADGSVIAETDHFGHDHDDPATPETHREYARMRRDGVLTGTVDAVRLFRTEQGQVVAVTSADLTITGGSRNFKDATGSGRIGPWPSLPRQLTLFLSVQVTR